MRKRLVVFCLAGFLISSAAFAQMWRTDTLEDALALAKAQGKLVLLDFFASSG